MLTESHAKKLPKLKSCTIFAWLFALLCPPPRYSRCVCSTNLLPWTKRVFQIANIDKKCMRTWNRHTHICTSLPTIFSRFGLNLCVLRLHRRLPTRARWWHLCVVREKKRKRRDDDDGNPTRSHAYTPRAYPRVGVIRCASSALFRVGWQRFLPATLFGEMFKVFSFRRWLTDGHLTTHHTDEYDQNLSFQSFNNRRLIL